MTAAPPEPQEAERPKGWTAVETAVTVETWHNRLDGALRARPPDVADLRAVIDGVRGKITPRCCAARCAKDRARCRATPIRAFEMGVHDAAAGRDTRSRASAA